MAESRCIGINQLVATSSPTLIQRIEPAFSRGFQLAFNRASRSEEVFANMVWDPWGTIWGAVYLCDVEAMASLDRAEGAIGHSYRPRWVLAETMEGEMLPVKAYLAGKKFTTKSWRPSEGYLQLMLQGMREHQLAEEYVRQIRMIAGEENELGLSMGGLTSSAVSLHDQRVRHRVGMGI